MCDGQSKQCEKCSTEGIINFYLKGIEIDFGAIESNIIAIAMAADKISEDERQLLIMEDMMQEFDRAACISEKVNNATDLFVGYDDDKVTNFQLEFIKKCCSDISVCSKTIKSCNVILEEGF